MGGLAGHMMSLTDDESISIKKIKQILSALGNGKITATEKTDGQNALFSAKEGKATLARNKTDARTGGWTIDTLSQREFAGGDKVKNVYLSALQSFQLAISKLDSKTQEKLFQNGTIFYNTEIISTANPNVIHYDTNILSIHPTGHIKVNPETHEIQSLSEASVDKLLDQLTNIENTGEFKITKDKPFKLPALQDKRDLKIANAKLNKILTANGLSDSTKLGDLIRAEFYRYVKEKLPDLSTNIQKLIVANVYNHAKLLLPKGTPPETKARIRAVKKNAEDIKKKTLTPIDEAILEFSMEMLKNVQSNYIANNAKEVARLRGEASRVIKSLQSLEDKNVEKLLMQQLSRLKNIENINSAIEGVAFQYEGSIYKLTGAFAPLNQLLGVEKYGRSGIPSIPPPEEPETKDIGQAPSRVLALLPGSFKPPHAGHYALAKFFADKKEIDEVIIFISPKERTGHTHDKEIKITANMSLSLWKLYTKDNPKIKPTIAPDTSPVRSVYDFILKLNDGDTIYLGQSEKEDMGSKGRFGKAEEWAAQNGIHITVKEVNTPVFAGNVSGTQVREIIAEGKKDIFFKLIPQHLSPEEKEEAWRIVTAGEKENLNEWVLRIIKLNLLQEIEDSLPSSPFQKKLFKKHPKDLKRLLGVNLKRNKSAPPIGENISTELIKPDQTLQQFLSGFLNLTFKQMQDQASTIRLYLMNQSFGDKEAKENIVIKFVSSLENFLNRYWIIQQQKPLKDIHNPSSEEKEEYEYDNYQNLFKEKIRIARQRLQSKSPEEKEENNIKLQQINQELTKTPWSHFMTQKYKEHEQITKEKETYKITEKEVQLDNSLEAQKLMQIYDKLKTTLIKEMSAMSGGAVEGGAGLFTGEDKEEKLMKTRQQFVEELQLREHIRSLIKNTYNQILQEQKEGLKEEGLLRSAIKMILQEWGIGQLNTPEKNLIALIQHKAASVTPLDIKKSAALSDIQAKEIYKLVPLVLGKNPKEIKKFMILAKRIINQKNENILQETDEDIPHASTGINVLEELLKKIIPVLEADFKTLTTSKDQRDSFRAHVIQAIQHTLVTDRMTLDQTANEDIPIDKENTAEEKAKRLKEKAGVLTGGAPSSSSGEIKEELSVDVGNKTTTSLPDETPPDENAFIDIEKDKTEPEKEDAFTVPGTDMTGRNMALKTFEKIQKQIVDAYSLLSAEEDKEVFYDYLLANVKLYSDKWEIELGQTTEEPTTSTYEKEKNKMADEKTAGEETAKSELGV